MKTYKNLWKKLISKENIIEAVYSAAHGNMKRKRLDEISNNIFNHINDVREMLTNYKPVKHTPVEINDGVSQKKRMIIVPTVEEHIVQHCVMNVLMSIFMKGMYEHSYASIPCRGCHAGMRRMRKWISKGGADVKYCGKFDIRKFFDNIDQDILIDKLKRVIKDDRFMNLLIQIIRTTEHGVPLGFYTSQWFANFYLQDFDHYVKEELGIKYYMRYMDDMVIFGSNKKKLHKAKNLMLNYLQTNLHVWFKDNWQIFRFDTKKHNKGRYLDFMGFKIYRDHVGIRRSIAMKAIRKAKRIYKKSPERVTVLDARQMLAYYGWLLHTDSYYLYKDYIEPYIDFNNLRKIISDENKERMKYLCGKLAKAL